MSLYSTDILEEFNVSDEEVSHFRDNHIGFCQIDISRVSHFLLIQLASAHKHRTFNVFSVTDVIREIEGVGRGCKYKADQFDHLPLKGFWKAHFVDARFLVRNIINHWGLEFERSPKFNKLCDLISEEEEKSPSVVGWQGRLAHTLIIDGYKKRAENNKLTGEWIIFSKYNDKNYYLCISKHTSKGEDKSLHDHLMILCNYEYPFLLSENAF